MNWDQIAGRWREVGGKAKALRDKLSDEGWRVVREKRDRLAAKIKQRYGVSTKEGEQHVKHFEDMD
jgi:uncharacterized protein YjbJ (UPF0337 family)